MADLSQPAPAGPGKGFRSMLDRLREKREAIAPTRIGRIERNPGEGGEGGAFPLSFGQQQLWFLEQIQPGNAAYSIFSAVRLEGPLDARALELSFGEIVRRHESLRTTFRTVGIGDTPMQVVSPPAPFPVPVVDLSGYPAAEREVRRLARSEAATPFDLARGPLLRVTLLRLSARDHVALLNLHHIIGDGWSLGILIREMTLLYESFVRGVPSPLPELSIQYADYAQWQRETLQGEALEKLMDFWRKRLSGTPPVLRLPGDRPRPPAPSFRGASIPVAFSGALRDSLLEMGRREGSTLFTILLAAFQTLLHRYSGQVDLWVGAPVANRKRVELQDLIGFFVNTLVMRGDLSGNPTFRELLSRLREMSLEAYAHQDLPFEKVVEELQPERSGAGAQLLQAVLAFDTAPEHTLSELELTVLPIEREASPFELTFNFVEGRDGVGGVIEYSTDLFDMPTIGRMAAHFETLLLAAAADPGRRLAELPLLGRAEEHQLVFERNDTRVEFPRESCVHELFDQVVDQMGGRMGEAAAGRTALACGGESLTYAELRRQADRLALFLRRLGVGPEVAVAICLDRSVDSIVALLAVLKAGGAYLPLDPAYPAERLAFMLEDSRAPVLLTDSRLLPRLPAVRAAVVCLDRDWERDREKIARLDGGAPPPFPAAAATADNLAYIMFTSGSTGRPKGVGVTHRNIVRLVRGANYVELGPDEVLLQLAPISFDAATLEIWGALLNGGRLEVFPPGAPTLHELGDFLVERGISVLWLTAGLFHQMVEVRPDSLRRVRQVLAGGDALSVPHVRRVLEGLGPDSRLIDGYGPTEGTTFSCCNVLRGPEGIGASVPIGRPISNARAYILDPDLRLVPGGVPGELYLGGDGLARGYLGRPDLTAERFIPDGFSGGTGGTGGTGGVAGERLYRTGDLARSLPDGTIEFLGRIDQQVKIRGFRVELGEVEAALAQCPGVAACAVVAREDLPGGNLPGGKQLVGYVVPETELSTDAQALRHALQERLPEYMIPAALVFLDALPLTPNGKVDRRALPAPGRTETPRVQAGPRTPLEELLAGLWAEVLGVPEVGPHDDFFELGGHSLLATRLMSRVRAVFEVDVPLRELFEAPTVATLALAIEAARTGEGALPAPPMERVPREGALPLSFAQERLWFLDQLEPDSPAYNVPFAVALRGPLSPPALEHGLRAVIERHETLRTTFRAAEGQPALEIAASDPRPLPAVDLSGLSGGMRAAEARRLIAAEARRPMSLLTGPLLRAGLIRMAPEEHLALLTLHHIVSDAWSMEILVRDLGAFYRGALESVPPGLPELPIQYADFSAWQRRWLQGEVLARELGFWRSRLERSPSVLDLPTDRLRSTAQTFRGSQEDLELPAALGDGVAALARREGVTVFMAGLAAFNALIYRYTGQPAFNVGTPIAGRNHLETENLIGFFVNTLVLPAGLSGDSGVDEVLAGVREVTLAAHAHQELPFERLVEELEPERSLTHSPLFQVMFVLRNLSREPVALAGLESEPLEAETGTTKFDLILSFREDARSLSARYKTDLFDGVTVQRLLGHYRRVLEGMTGMVGMTEEPRRRVADLPLLSEAERRQVLEEWNDTVEAFPPDRCLHELFEEQVERTPEAPAVVFEGRGLTYRELNERANRLAGFLRGRGVGPEVPVGLFLERSLEMVVALYGVLKAGGLYVALAPGFPRERLAFMFEEARVPVLLTQRRLADALPEIAAEVVCLDALVTGEQPLSGPGTENPASGALPANVAYMIYTSGSTGRPKGVVVEHRQVVHYVRSLVARTGLLPGWSFAALQSPAVDSSKTVLFPALLTGGCLHMISEDRATDAHALGAYVAGERIDVLKIAPSHLGTLMSAGEPARMLPRRLLIFGGEPSTREWAARLAGLAPDLPMYSNYGPTETTVGSSMYRVRAEALHDVPLLPLGRAFPNTLYYLLDRDFRPVPVGVPGELYIGGRQVTRGYLHRPGLTAERFLPDPFNLEAGARMYRSGDRARYLPDGELESLGRTDHQVKVRGFRVELGEIEAMLSLHPGVEACAVSTWEESPGDRRLAGFIVAREAREAREEGGADAAGLRGFLRERLPEYMVPSVFVFLDALPRSVHGKVDRQALKVPAGFEPAGTGEPYEAPRTAAEQRLAGLWGEVLGRERIGVHDNFFELGGHSLLATRLVSRIRDAFQAELPLRRLFEQPTIAGLAAELETAGAMPLEAPPIVPVPRDAVTAASAAVPLSFAQERLWFLDQLLPGSAAYNIPAAVRLEGRLSIPVLRASLDEIVRRHEVLRTTFPASPASPAGTEGPVQRIAQPAPAPLPLVDLSGLDGERRPSEAGRLCDEEARRPFDLVRGPLVRAALLRLGPEEHLALVTLHHIVSDGWSTGVLVRETATLYEAFSAGRPSPLPELPVQYADFSAWQRRWLEAGAEEAQLAYWRERLRGAPPALDLPTDRPRPPVPGWRGGLQAFELTAADAASLRRLAQREGATLFMVFLAGLDALLARYSGQTDLLVGTPIAGRNRSEIEPLIGFFVNTLVLRVDLSGEPSAGEALARVRTASLEAYARQDLPFERLVEALAPERSLGRSPLFQVLFAYQNAPRETLRLPDLNLSYVPTDAGVAKFDLSLTIETIEEDAEVLRGAFSYSRDLFEATTVERMAGHLQRGLRGMAEEPGTPLSHLPLLAPAERQAILVEWNDTWRDYPRELTLHGLFERQADRAPGALAVMCGDARLTYGELERSANRLAHRLSDAGVRRGDRVGIALERSPEMVVALLAVLKSGAAYVPLDPEYPAERLAYMLEDSGVELLLSSGRLELPPHSVRVLDLDEAGILDGGSAERPDSGVGGDDLAYVIYTSGSTGRPKGAMLNQGAAVNQMLWLQETLLLTADDRVFQKTAFSFDASVWEFYAPLLAGATLVLARPGGHRDPDYLIRTMQEHGVTILQVVPSLLRALLEQGGLENCRSLRMVFCGAESLVPDLVALFFRALDADLINVYGPAETAIQVTSWRCRPGQDPVPIGRPLSNCRLFVATRGFEPAPIGVPGELLIGGRQVCRGYLGAPALTAEKFIPDPFSASPGARLYRTGDRGRVLPDGLLEFFGRIDNQVKVRGFRIELGEIETALARYPGVREAVVLVRGEGVERSLAAYLVPPVAESAAGLREHLRASLPEHMIPSAFAFLEAMPLSPSGKVDRQALARQTAVEIGEAEGDTAPRNEVEQRLADLWREVLGRESIGIHSNFFDLGGHSLLATRLMSRVRSAFGVEVPLRELFTSPTVATLAAAVEAAGAGDGSLPMPPMLPMLPIPRDGALPLSFAQERLWFLDQLEPDSPAYNIPFAVSLRGPLSPAALEHGLRAVIERHETLRTTFRTVMGTPVQVIAPPDARSLAVADLSGLPAAARLAESRRLIESEARRPFDLLAGPLLRACLVRLSPDEHLALLTMHHILSDAWSVEILVRDLGAFYRAGLGMGGVGGVGVSASLPDLPIQYADFSSWQRQWLRGEALDRELAFWRGRLQGSPSVLDMPTDRPRSAARTFRGAQQQLDLPAALAERLPALVRREGVTIFMAGLAALGALVYRYTGQPAFNLGTPIAGRNHLETEDLIGFFVNTLVLPVRLSGHSRFDEVLARLREVTLAAHSHQELPFERLVEELEPERSLTHSPLFQVMFGLRNLPRQPASLGDLELDLLSADTGMTKFDLILSLREDARHLSLRYKTDLFEAATVQRFLGHYQRLLESAVEDPRRRISDLTLLSEAEERQVLEEWNDTVEAFPPDRCLHELFEEQVERSPEAPAVFFEGSRLTYRELNEQANRLAHFLRGRGVGPEVPVGLFLERSPEMIVALYGVLKAGGLYVALAPSFPRERLAFMFEEARAPVLLTQRRLAAALPEVAAEVVCLDAAEELLSGYGTENPASGALPDNAAYMIYTSGSTGRPKGVVVEHRQVLSYVRSLERRADLQPGWSFAVVQSPAVDSSKTVLYPALLTGGCLHMISEDRVTDAQALGDYLAGEKIDVLKIAPSHLGAMMGAGELERLLPARLLIFGGEPSTREWAARLAEAAPDLPMHSNYGPTETTVGSSMYRVRAETLHGVPLLPLGRAFPNTRYYLLDPDLRPVPMGAPGELFIAGRQVTRGYLRAPDMTAERFLPDPFSHEAGARMYRSGDRARYLPDGELESLGRTDHQIKVRGFRVELGEIESVLNLHPGVEACAVSTWEARPGDRRLAGFVVAREAREAREEGGADAAGLREFLRERLPEYMVPSAFVFLDRLPRSVHGKMDRQALVVPAGFEALGSGELYEAPRTAAEQRLAELWGEVLGSERVGVHDNFFQLGGHSLLAARLVSRIREAFQVELPLRRLFQQPTIAGLVKELETPGAGSLPEDDRDLPARSSSLVTLQPRGSEPPFFFVHPAGGHVSCYIDLARAMGDEQPFYGLQVTENGQPAASIGEMAAQYVEAVLSVQPEGPYRLGGWSLGGVIAQEMARQLWESGRPAESLVLIDSFAPDPAHQDGNVSEASLLARFARDLARLSGKSTEDFDLADLGEDGAGALGRLFARAEARGLVPPDLALQDAEALFAIFRTNVLAVRSFRPRLYPGRLLLVRATRSPADHGWEGLAQEVEIEDLAGDHYSILRDPSAGRLADLLKLRLEPLLKL